MNTVKETIQFISGAITSFRDTGSIFPTSRWAAKELTSPLRAVQGKTARNILELGPGTGSVTERILKDMREDDSLFICELNPKFMKALKGNLQNNADYQKHKSRVTFFLGAAQDISVDTKFDVVVCALPFLNFDKETVTSIFNKIKELSAKDAVMTYYEYIGLRRLSKLLPERQGRVKDLEPVFKHIDLAKTNRKRIWLNMLPVNIYTMLPTALPDFEAGRQ